MSHSNNVMEYANNFVKNKLKKMKLYKINTNTLSYEDVTVEIYGKIRELKLKMYVCAVTSIVILLMHVFNSYLSQKDLKSKNNEIAILKSNIAQLQKVEDSRMNLHNVDKYIDKFPFKDKHQVKRQMRLESGNTLSKIARNNNNLFGMRNAGKRIQLGNKGEYRIYNNWNESVIDRYLYELYNGNSLKNYAKDINYKSKLK